MKTSLYFVSFREPGSDLPLAAGHVLARGPASAVSAAFERLKGRVDLREARCSVRSGIVGYGLDQPDTDPFFDPPVSSIDTRVPGALA